MKQNYKIEYTQSSRDDMRKMKKYILDTFKYRELGENFTRKMKEAAKELKPYRRDSIRSDFSIVDMTFT